jgi:phosphoribosylformylglycinamidine synthase subunit PurL
VGARVALGGVQLFAEGPGAFLVSGPPEAMAAFGAAARVIGEVGGDALAIAGELDLPVAELARVHSNGLAELLQ